jgi:uracil-DNA glycosylase
MSSIDNLLERSRVHPEWQAILRKALAAVDAAYLDDLVNRSDWLPGCDQLLAAFRRDRKSVKYILIGESPYPRHSSANGIAFYDAAVTDLWSDTGLSKPVNKATSMRNIIKTALVAQGYMALDDDGKITQPNIAAIDKVDLIQTMAELFQNLQASGFLMLNATPVLHPERKPVAEAKYWQGFLASLLQQLAVSTSEPLTLVLWGKIAETIESMPFCDQYQKLVSEHPYNISFINNENMKDLFHQVSLLTRNTA